MSANKPSPDLFKRHKTRNRGITYRVRADGSRQYHVYCAGRQVAIDGGEKEAVAKQAELRGKLARGEKIAPTNVRFAETAEQWLGSKRKLRAWTRKNYRASLDNELLPRFGHLKLAEVTPDHLARLIRELEARGLASSTIDNHLKPLQGTLSFAVRRGLLSINPCALLTSDDRPTKRQREQPHEWSDAEIESLLEASETIAARPTSHYDYSPLLRTAVYTGLRLGELLGLEWQDIDFEEGVLHVRRQWTRTRELAPPKTAKGLRRVPLAAEMVSVLRRHRVASSSSQDDHPVFASKAGGHLSHRNVQRRGFEPARDLAGIEGVSFHDQRHAFASLCAHRGVPVDLLSEVLGHSDISVTLGIYTHLYNREAAEETFRVAMQGPS